MSGWFFEPTPEGWESDAELCHNDKGYGYKFANSIDVETGNLFADVLNVHEATGLTPSQLLQKTGGSTATAPITRLDWLGEEGMKEFDDGEYVFYADHQQTVAQLQARVAELEAALREGTDTLRSLGNMPDYLVHDDAWDKEQVARKIVAYTQLLGS